MSALSFLSRAEIQFSRGRCSSAHTLLAKSLQFPTDPFLRAEIFSLDAQALRALGRFRESLTRYREAHKIFRRLNVFAEELSMHLGASACLRVLGSYDIANKEWTAFRGRWPQRNESALAPLRIDAELEQALVARGQGRFGVTRSHVNTAMKFLSFCPKPDRVARIQHAQWIMGGVERFSGRFDASVVAFNKAASLARSMGDRSAEAYALLGAAGVLRVLGRDRVSYTYYRRAHGLMVKEADRFGQAYGLCGQANALRTFGSAAKAVGLYKRSARLYQSLGDKSSEGFAHWGLAGSWRRLKNFSKARASYNLALELFLKSQDDRGVVMAYVGLARWWEDQGNVVQAVASVRRALSTAKKARLAYESALARYEQGRILHPDRPPVGRLRPFGIPASVLARWKDVP